MGHLDLKHIDCKSRYRVYSDVSVLSVSLRAVPKKPPLVDDLEYSRMLGLTIAQSVSVEASACQ